MNANDSGGEPQAIRLADRIQRHSGDGAHDQASHWLAIATADGKWRRADMLRAICTILSSHDRVTARWRLSEKPS